MSTAPRSVSPSLIEFVFDTIRGVTHLVLSGTLERYPNLRLIVPHAGGTLPFLVDRIGLLATRFVPTGARVHQPPPAHTSSGSCELAISANPHAIGSLVQLVPISQILCGSDWPALTEEDVSALIQGLVNNPLLQPTSATTVLVLALGLNISIFGPADVPRSSAHVVAELVGLIVTIVVVYAVVFVALEWVVCQAASETVRRIGGLGV